MKRRSLPRPKKHRITYRLSAFAFGLTIAQSAPALAGPLLTFQNQLTAPDAGMMAKGLVLAGGLFSVLITCAIVVRLTRLGWSNNGSFAGWQTELGDMVYNIMLPGYATMLAANILLPQIQPIVNAISTGIIGHPGIADPDVIFTLGIVVAGQMFAAALHPVTQFGHIGPIPIPNFGLDAIWMTLVNIGIACVAGFLAVINLTRVAFELIAAVAGGMFEIAVGSISVAFSGPGATRDVAMRYANAVWVKIMNMVGIVAYAAIVVQVFAAVEFTAGLANAGTFIQTALTVTALSYAVGAGAKRVSSIGERMFSGGVFISGGHVMSEAMAAPRAAAGLAVTAGKAAMRRA